MVGAILLAFVLLIRRAKQRRFLRPRLLEMSAIGEDEPKSPAIRYPSTDLSRGSHYSANLSTDTRGSIKGMVKPEDIMEEIQ